MKNQPSLNFGGLHQHVEQRLDRWAEQNFARRVWSRDFSLWQSEPQPDLADRMGWLDLPQRMEHKCDAILSFARQIKEEGLSHVLLLGMGGSSLAAEVFQKTFGSAPGFPELFVLDSTHPAAVTAVERGLNLTKTLVLVASKSGTTLETLSLFRYFWARLSALHNRPGHYFAAITDAGSYLARLAGERNFRRTFLPASDVGGRYSAFTEFGLVPAALIGLDIRKLLEKARAASENSRVAGAEKKSAGYLLGAVLGELARYRDKITIWTTPSLAGFPAWLEQLLAESTGKQGKGIVPVVEEPVGRTEIYGQDRIFAGFFFENEPALELEKHLRALEAIGHPTIRIELKEKCDLGTEIFRWELAAASAGAVLGIHPFNQPDVQLAKDLTRQTMEKSQEERDKTGAPIEEFSIKDEKTCAAALRNFLSAASPGDYIALQAYLPPTQENTRALRMLGDTLLENTRLATTLGFGPRYLHSTGQLHKGGPNTVLALQIIDRPEPHLPIPETDYTFASLIEAQALGDYRALRERDRRVLRITVSGNAIEGVKTLAGFIG